ncbi:hypothetical protein OIU76_023146 [Salix suchowensis]|uniref:Uncharacterized protein n=1 Tax=Salix suchowensis TaxID=1278906 RepID=A0ABQ9AJR8_9ROSI|nr:hypothetical protein OIU76_023146 [Salix suchowensis]KAJ6340276.1 hypothetical protein OIU77_008102 [Salix suchowensis]
MADDGAEVEKKNLHGSSKTPKPGGGGIVLALQKKSDLPSKIPKPKSKKLPADLGGRRIVLALVVLNREGNVKKKKRTLNEKGEEGSVKKKKKKRTLNEKGEEGSDDLPQDVKEGSDDLPQDVMEGAVMNHGDKPRRSVRTIKLNPKYAQ